MMSSNLLPQNPLRPKTGYDTILYSTIRYYTILYYTILYTILYYTILYYIYILQNHVFGRSRNHRGCRPWAGPGAAAQALLSHAGLRAKARAGLYRDALG